MIVSEQPASSWTTNTQTEGAAGTQTDTQTDSNKGGQAGGWDGPEVVPVHSNGGILAGSDEGVQVMGVHHG